MNFDLEFDKLFTLALKVTKHDVSVIYSLQVKGSFKFLEEGQIYTILIFFLFL